MEATPELNATPPSPLRLWGFLLTAVGGSPWALSDLIQRPIASSNNRISADPTAS